MSERKPAYPAHTPDMHEDEDEDEKNLLYVRQQERNRSRDLRDLLRPHRDRRKRDHQYGKIQLKKLEPEVSKDSREQAEDTSTLCKKAEGEALRNIMNKLSDERNLKGLDLEHYQMSISQFKKRTTHLDIPGRIYDLCQHVVKTCPFQAAEFGDLIFLDHGSAKIGHKNYWILDCIGWCCISFDSISMQEYFSIRSNFKTS